MPDVSVSWPVREESNKINRFLTIGIVHPLNLAQSISSLSSTVFYKEIPVSKYSRP